MRLRSFGSMRPNHAASKSWQPELKLLPELTRLIRKSLMLLSRSFDVSNFEPLVTSGSAQIQHRRIQRRSFTLLTHFTGKVGGAFITIRICLSKVLKQSTERLRLRPDR